MLSTTTRTSYLPHFLGGNTVMDKFSEFSDRLRHVISLTGHVPASFAKAIGIPHPTLSSYINDNREPKVSLLGAIRRNFPYINIDWLLLNEGEPILNPKDEKGEMEKKLYEANQQISHLMEKEQLYERMIRLVDKDKGSTMEFHWLWVLCHKLKHLLTNPKQPQA